MQKMLALWRAKALVEVFGVLVEALVEALVEVLVHWTA